MMYTGICQEFSDPPGRTDRGGKLRAAQVVNVVLEFEVSSEQFGDVSAFVAAKSFVLEDPCDVGHPQSGSAHHN
jgi:hypothetical protein